MSKRDVSVSWIRGIILMIVVLLLNGCINNNKVIQEEVYSNNDRLVEQADTFSYTDSKEIKQSSEQLSLEFATFTGVNTMWKITADEEKELELQINQHIDEGEFKTIVVGQEQEVSILCEGDRSQTTSIKLQPNEEYRIKIVGSQAKGKIDINLKPQNGVHLDGVGQ
ncbi:hypothetical protein D3C77_350080 [compost metagenome]